MLKTLYSKLAIVLFGLFFITGIFFIILTVFSTELYQSEINQKLNLKLAENIVAEKLLIKDNRINEVALKEIFHMLMVINPSIELYLLDSKGRILSYSAPPETVKITHVDLTPVQNWFSDTRVLPIDGIPEDELPNIFNRFYRVDKSRKPPAGHSGLGLAITKRILELHDRSITASSVINQGTTFTFQVPAYTS